MKLKIFDVVELINGNKATILSNDNNIYKAEIVDNNGTKQKISNIVEKDIRKIIVSRENKQ